MKRQSGDGLVTDLVYLLDPPVDPIKGPAVGDVVHKNNSLQKNKTTSLVNYFNSLIKRDVFSCELESGVVNVEQGFKKILNKKETQSQSRLDLRPFKGTEFRTFNPDT